MEIRIIIFTIITIVILITITVIILKVPLLIWCFYSCARFSWINGNTDGYSLETILSYSGSVLSFIGTIVLGCVTIYLTNRANKTNETLMNLERDARTPILSLLTKTDIVPEIITGTEWYTIFFYLENISKIPISNISVEKDGNLFNNKALSKYEVEHGSIQPQKIATFGEIINKEQISNEKYYQITVLLNQDEVIPNIETAPLENIISFTIEVTDVFGNKKKQNFLVSGYFSEDKERLYFIDTNYLSKLK